MELVKQLISSLNPWIAIIVLTAINTISGMLWFLAGWLFNLDWFEKRGKIDREQLAKVQRKVERYGAPIAAFAWLPVVGTPIAVSLGLLRCPPLPTLIFMTIGKLARNIVVISLLGHTAQLVI